MSLLMLKKKFGNCKVICGCKFLMFLNSSQSHISHVTLFALLHKYRVSLPGDSGPSTSFYTKNAKLATAPMDQTCSCKNVTKRKQFYH